MKELTIISQILIFLAKSVHFTYVFQIKEYRWDRVFSRIKEEKWLRFLYNRDVRLPAYKTRNYLIICGTFITIPIVFFGLRNLPLENIIIFYTVLPIFSFVNVFFWVILTSIPAKITREKTIKKASAKLARSQAKIIAISGTYGKSSVKEFLYQILSKKFKVAKTDANMNTDVGVAISILKNLDEKKTEFFITEVGAYKMGEIAKICRYIKPDIGILTSAGNQHVDLFGSKENLVKAEAEILSYMKKENTVFINQDIPDIKNILKESRGEESIFFSWKNKENSDIHIDSINTMDNKTTATVQYGKNSFHITTSLLGEHVIYNLLPCIGIASKLGMTKEEIEKAVKNLKPIKDKLSLHEGNSKYVKILSDCSNSNLEGFIQALKVGERLKNFDEKILITKGIIELGKDKKMSYEKILQELRNTSIKIYSTDKDFAEIHSSNLKNNLKGEKDQIEFFPMEEDMISRVEERIKKTGNSKKKLLLIIEGRFSSEVLKKVGKE